MKDFIITKRDGSHDRFSLDKIMNAIIKAFQSVGEDVDLNAVSKILSHLSISEGITVEDIQNQVEEALMREGYYKVAKSFMLYRQRHNEDRETLEKLKFLTDYCKASNAATGSKFDANANVEHKKHRNSYRRITQGKLHPSEPPSARRPYQANVRKGRGRGVYRQAQPPLYI